MVNTSHVPKYPAGPQKHHIYVKNLIYIPYFWIKPQVESPIGGVSEPEDFTSGEIKYEDAMLSTF